MQILVDKPAGMTSFGVVARVRRVLTERARAEAIQRGETPPKRVRVGHTGTLDPFATGLLILMTGKDTRRCQEFLKLDKEYEATIRLGATSTTGDPEGEITETSEEELREGLAEARKADLADGMSLADEANSNDFIPTEEEVKKVVQSFQGKITQKLPIYSAVKVNGERAYRLARKGVEVEMPEREAEIYKNEVVEYAWPELKIRAHVSSGTYIRTLGEDIGKKLGVGGYLTALRRTRVGKYSVAETIKLEEAMAEGNGDE